MWNFMLRTLIEATLDLALISMVETYVLNLENWGHTISFTISCLVLAALVLLALITRFYLGRLDLSCTMTVDSVGTIYDGLIHKKSSLMLPEWFIYRRLLFAASALYARGNLIVIFYFLFQSSLVSISIVLKRVYELPRMNNIELLNEAFILLVQYHLLVFTDFGHEAETRNQYGTSCVIVILTCIVVNFLSIL